METYRQILIGFLICIALEFAVYNLNHKYHLFEPFFVVNKPVAFEKHEGGGSFTNPLLECLSSEQSESLEQFSVSKDKVSELVEKVKVKHGLTDISVYVRDLNNGPWMGINQDKKFIGGSLLKVPMLISYLKLAEDDPNILKKEIEYKEQKVTNDQYFSPSRQIEVGKKYTVGELLEYMIYYSDNNAAYLLSENIDHVNFNRVFAALGFGDPDPNQPFPVDTKTYAGFFRILFNSSYLSKLSSEKALFMLSKSEFNRGLQALLPKNILVSHKFGIRSDGPVNQLHDCGIVYYPNNPYLVCIMSRGGTFDNMADSIAEVSKFVYDEVAESQH